MGEWIIGLLRYTIQITVLTLGVVIGCGLVVHLCSYLFMRLMGRKSLAFFNTTAAIGTPVHELGHAMMCSIFGHQITDMKLWIPRPTNGVYGYVAHSYNPKNIWHKLGNLFIGLGPIFSGLGVVVLSLWLCFPTQWASYLNTSHLLVDKTTTAQNIFEGVFSLLASIPAAFAESWWRALIGIVVILAVSLHVSLSWADIKGSAGAFPIYVGIVFVFALITQIIGIPAIILSALQLFSLRLLSLFCLVAVFAAVWVVIALLINAVKAIFRAAI